MEARRVESEELGLRGRRRYWLAGALPPAPRLAVVGSRGAHAPMRRAAAAVVRAAESLAWSVVSGGAVGIDTQAHRTAAELRCPQLAVLPCGPDRVYPESNRSLFESMIRDPGSGLLYCHEPGTELARGMFASRNEVLVRLCSAVVVAEAAVPSGSLSTGERALRRGLPVATVLGSPGAHRLAAQGAFPVPCSVGGRQDDSAACGELAQRWLRSVAEGQPLRAAGDWPGNLDWLREILSAQPGGVTVGDCGADVLRAAVALTEAEALGLVVEVAPGRYASAERS